MDGQWGGRPLGRFVLYQPRARRARRRRGREGTPVPPGPHACRAPCRSVRPWCPWSPGARETDWDRQNPAGARSSPKLRFMTASSGYLRAHLCPRPAAPFFFLPWTECTSPSSGSRGGYWARRDASSINWPGGRTGRVRGKEARVLAVVQRARHDEIQSRACSPPDLTARIRKCASRTRLAVLPVRAARGFDTPSTFACIDHWMFPAGWRLRSQRDEDRSLALAGLGPTPSR